MVVRRRHRRILATLSTAVLVAGMTACGTTVRNPNGVALPGGLSQPSVAANGLSASSTVATGGSGNGIAGLGTSSTAPGGTTVTGGTIVPGTTVTSAAGSHGGSGTGSGGTSTSGGGGSTGSGGTSGGSGGITRVQPTNGPGTLSPVKVGMVYIPDADAFANLFGGSAKVGDQLTEAQAAVNYVNAHGGLAGHPITPEYYSQSITNTAPYSTSMAAICSAWTQDEHVAAGLFIGGNVPDVLAQCLNAQKVTYISGGFYLHDETTYASLPNFYSPYEASVDRAMSALISYLLANHKLTSKDKVGVLLADNEPAAARTYSNVVVPELKAHGIKVSSYDVEFPASTLDASASLNEVSSDQLHMRSDGVTNVLFMAPGGEATFIKDASNQNWKPSYALTSIDQPYGLPSSDAATNSELTGTVGIGWEPNSDVGTYDNNVFTNSATNLCKSIEGATGQVTGEDSQFAAYQWCDALLSLQDAADAAGSVPTLTGPILSSGFARMGPRTSAVAISTDVTGSQHAGVNAYRPLAYEPSCSCFQYTGPAVRF